MNTRKPSLPFRFTLGHYPGDHFFWSKFIRIVLLCINFRQMWDAKVTVLAEWGPPFLICGVDTAGHKLRNPFFLENITWIERLWGSSGDPIAACGSGHTGSAHASSSPPPAAKSSTWALRPAWESQPGEAPAPSQNHHRIAITNAGKSKWVLKTRP